MVTELLKDVYRIEVPLPKSPLKLLNSYLIKGNERSLIIDTGFNRPECREALMSALKELKIDFNETDLILTHLHADHSGLMFSIKTDNNIAYAEKREASIVNKFWSEDYWNHLYEEFKKEGLRLSRQEAIETHPGVMYSPDRKIDFTEVIDGQILKVGDYNLRCVITPGHTPGHTCLYDDEKKVLFAGDMILGDITPNLCYELYLEDPLTEYVKSLNRLEKMDIETIFVGHRNMLKDVYGRIKEIKTHHILRCQEALQTLKDYGPMDSWSAAAHMTWAINAKNWEDFPSSQKWFATGEAAAHMVFLYNNGKVRRHYNDDGVKIYEFVDDNIDGLIN